MIERRSEPESMNLPAEAKAYAAADFSEVNQAFVDRLAELLGEKDFVLAIDLGCGPADIPIRLVRDHPHWRILAVDVAPAMLDIAREAVDREGVADNVQLVQADAKALATYFQDEHFDVVMSNSILHHIGHTDAFWHSVHDLAADGGLVFMRDLFRPDSEEQIDRLVAEHAAGESHLLQREFRRSLWAAYTIVEIRTQLDAADLGHLEIRQVSDRHVDVFGWM